MDNKISFDDFLDSIKKAVEDMRSFVFKEIHSKFLELKKAPLDSTLGEIKLLSNAESLSIEFDFWKAEENEDGLPVINLKLDGDYIADQGILYNLSQILKIIEDCYLKLDFLECLFENGTYTVTNDQVSFQHSFDNSPEKIIYKTSEVE